MRARFEGVAHAEALDESPTGRETTFRIVLTSVTDVVPLGDPSQHPAASGPALDDQRIEACNVERVWHEWVWAVEVESYDFDYATRRISGVVRFDRALPPPPVAAPVVVPTPVAAPVVATPVVPPVPVPPPAVPAPRAPSPSPAPAPARSLAFGDSIRWWVLIALATLGWSLSWLVTRTRGSERGLVMALVSAVVLGVVYLRERRRVAIG